MSRMILWASCALILNACAPASETAASDSAANTAKLNKAKPSKRVKKQCPPALKGSPRSASAQTDDLLSVRIGAPLSDALAVIECAGDSFEIEYADQYHLQGVFRQEGRQFLSANIYDHCDPADINRPEQYKRPDGSWDLSQVVSDCLSVEDEDTHHRVAQQFYFALAGVKDQEKVVGMWRSRLFRSDKRPPIESITNGFIKKYGEPHYRDKDSGGIDLSWHYLPDGKAVASSLYSRYGEHKCTNISSDGTDRQQWSAECGLSIVVHIESFYSNDALAEGFSVGIVDQAHLYTESAKLRQILETQFNNENKARKAKELEAAKKSAADVDF